MLRRSAISTLFVVLVLTAAARTRPHYGGTLHVETAGDPWARHDGIARRLVYDGLTQMDSSGALRPALALAWESDNSDHRWQFRLRPGVHFHDGSTLTSAAVVTSLTSSCGADCPWTAVKAVGPLVVFTSEAPMPNLPALLADDVYLIGYSKTGEGPTLTRQGTGPFQVAGVNSDVLSLTANESCWQGRPFVDAIEIRMHRAVREQWLDLSVGRTDLAEVPIELLRQAQQQRLTVLTSQPVALVVLQVSDTGALANVRVRAAIAAAIDRSAIYNVIFQKQGEVTASLLPQRLTGYSFLFPTDRDLNKAHELRGGLATSPLTIVTEGDGAMQLAAQRIGLNLREAGFNVQMASADAQRADLILRRIPLVGDDPGAVLEQAIRSTGDITPIAAKTPTDLLKLEQTVLDEKKAIPLLNLPRCYAIGARIRDLRLREDGTPDLPDASLEAAQ